ncbi:inositol monophosphatase family protein [Streptomyces sp. NPDC015032]|uniref:inositol monophosphatase family protein n=1 Tax=Streptomyces sp. NPDC015032 TaxID=3364937 RepID=UPI00370142AE
MTGDDPLPARDPSLEAVLGPVLDEATAEIEAFRKGPALIRFKPSIHGGMEPVTELDLRLQDLITAALGQAWPGLPVIAEERRRHLGPLPDDCLLVDPLDGTAPFLEGSSCFAIAVCLVRSGVPVQGIVDLPAFNVRVSAAAGSAPAVTGDVERLPAFASDTVVTSPRHTELATRLLPGLPVVGVPTASVKMTLVALGRARAAAYLPAARGTAAPWDYAAAALAVHAAGGEVRDPTGRDLARTLPTRLDGWLATSTAQFPADLQPLMHTHS